MSGLQLMIPPFVACMVLVAMLSYLGLHVIAREVIFVDLSLAQMAALGGLTALLVHVAPDSGTAYLFALLATALGAFVFALTRTSGAKGRVPQEAFIGIVYVVASGAAILVAYIAWGSGALASILGLWLSLAGDLPTGPLIVCMYGVVLVGAIALRRAAGATG